MKTRYLIIFLTALTLACTIAVKLLIRDDPGTTASSPARPITEFRHYERSVPSVEKERIPVLPVPLQEPAPTDVAAPPAFQPLDTPAWRVWGFVKEPGGVPVVGARVLLHLEVRNSFCYAPLRTPADPVFTDEHGRYQLQLLLPWNAERFSPSRSVTALISGRALATGHHPSADPYDTEEYSLSLGEGFATVRFDFEIEPGPVLQGTVFGAQGEPSAGAVVCLWEAGDVLRLEYETETDAAGGYAIPMDQCPVDGMIRITAAKSGKGFSSTSLLSVNPNRDMVAPPLWLDEHRAIEGVLQYPDGRAIRDMVVCAFPAESKELPPGLLPAADTFSSRALLNGESGLPHGCARTGPDGRFRIGGLRPGEYFLRVQSDGNPEDEQRIFCEAGGRNIRFPCRVHVLEILCRDEQGYLIPNAEITFLNDGIHRGTCAFGGKARVQVKPGPVSLRGMTSDGAVARRELFVSGEDYETRVEFHFRHERRALRLRPLRKR